MRVLTLAIFGALAVQAQQPPPAGPVTMTYLGTAGWEISDGRVTILLDPYLTRVPRRTDSPSPPSRGAFVPRIDPTQPLVTDTAAVNAHIRRADYVLVHHTHYDHVMDVPYIARKTGAIVIGTESAANLMRASGLPAAQIVPVNGGEDLEFGAFSVRVLRSLHGGIPGQQYPDAPPIPPTVRPPFKFDDLAEGGSLSYLIRIGGHVILTSGSSNFIERELEGLRPDVALVGALNRESVHDYTGRLMRVLGYPPLVLPTHWDDYFLPFDSAQTAFRKRVNAFINEIHAASPTTRVIVPEYFTPITLDDVAPRRGAAPAQPASCDAPAPIAITTIAVPGNPFQAIATPDGCAVFVSLARTTRSSVVGIAVLRRAGGNATYSHTIPLHQSPRGMVLTHDGTLLVVAADSAVDFIDVARALANDGAAVIGEMKEPTDVSRIAVNVTRDDRWLFVSNERDSSIAVIDLAAARRTGFARSAIVGTIPTGIAPIAVELSPDERYLYTTSERVREELRWPNACKPEVGTTRSIGPHAGGTVSVIDVARATRDPAHGVIASAPAACSPVRLVLSAAGDVAYVTARNSDAVLAFDTRKLRDDPAHALIDSIAVGVAPVGIAIINDGKQLAVANSNRFAGSASRDEELTVLDVVGRGPNGLRPVGRIPAGAFPRELHLTPDGRTLIITNFNSRTVELARLPDAVRK